MSSYLAERISKNQFKKQHGLYTIDPRPKYVIGYDSEADTSSDGRPMLFQFSLPEQTEDNTILYEIPPTKHAGLGTFLDFIDCYCNDPKVEYLIYGWNNTYELTQIFHDLPDSVKNESEFSITGLSRAGIPYGWTIRIANYKRQIVEFTKGKVLVSLLDGTAFYKTSLDNAAKLLGLGHKYQLTGLSRSEFTRADITDTEFLSYSRRDAYITRKIGEYIQEQHRQYAVNTCISAPQFAATVFKTHFLSGVFHVPDSPLEQAGLYSYHGGKNGYYLDGPAEFATAYQYDITSAYPEAMRQLPDIEKSSWTRTGKYLPNEHALYLVNLDYKRCLYRGMQNHDGTWTPEGTVIDTWITGYELDQIMAQNEATIISCRGYLYRGPLGGALADYVDRFFTIKRNSSGPERETAKLLLNSLYGKFFQKQPIGSVGTYDIENERWRNNDPNSPYDYMAGGLYNPPLASLITGYVRAKIHGLEHKYESVMTSTDGLFAVRPPDTNDIGTELGQLTQTVGRLRIWRERLYIFDSNNGKRKFALHGFHAGVRKLGEIPLARGDYLYYGKQMITLKMSTRQARNIKYSPGQFVDIPYMLRV